MINKTSLQTIKALAQLAKLPSSKLEGVVSIAHKIHAPQNYLGKILQRLTGEGLVVSQKGLKGGFRLAKSPARISLYEVISCLEDIKRWECCFFRNGQCCETEPCAMHKRWEGVRRAYIDFLKNTTISDIQVA